MREDEEGKEENKHERYMTAAYIHVSKATEWKAGAAYPDTEGETNKNGKHVYTYCLQRFQRNSWWTRWEELANHAQKIVVCLTQRISLMEVILDILSNLGKQFGEEVMIGEHLKAYPPT
jgi:hypothetical protein